jgi:predicted O-methyltransferase YrrM
MTHARVIFFALIGATLIACVVAANSVAPGKWPWIAAAAGFLAIVAGLWVLSLRLWQLSADFRDTTQASSRVLASEMHSMHVILNRFPECSLATSGYSMTFANLQVLMDLLDESQPDTVVEFGSGLSTVLVAAWMKRRGRGLLRSFDHDAGWADKTSRHLAKYGLDRHCQLSCVPLSAISVEGHTVEWYTLPPDVQELPGIDLVIVDGPPSHAQAMARLPALFAVEARLSDDCCVILDDAMRPEEIAVAGIWRQHLRWCESYTIAGPTGLAVFRRRVASSGTAANDILPNPTPTSV